MEFNVLSFITQIAVLIVALGAVHRPLGAYLARVADGAGQGSVCRRLRKMTPLEMSRF